MERDTETQAIVKWLQAVDRLLATREGEQADKKPKDH
jgi:hypothetical protein